MSQKVLTHLIDQQQELLSLMIRKTEIDVLIEDTVSRLRNYLAMCERLAVSLDDMIGEIRAMESMKEIGAGCDPR